jgi:5-(carboxyamino)imidazole ribonucleotide synthase
MTHSLSPLYPPEYLGILGGGQLGRYFVQAAQDLGYRVCVLDPDPLSPAGQIAQKHILAQYDDQEALKEMTQTCKAISTEFENVPAKTIDELISLGAFVAPNSRAVSIAQNRIKEKQFLTDCKDTSQVGPVSYQVIQNLEQCQEAPHHLLPGILKTAEFGYDGKGQQTIRSKENLAQAWIEMGSVPCVLEKKEDLAFELSVIIVRGLDNAMDILPVAQNIHQNGILHLSMVPAPDLNAPLLEKIHVAAQTISRSLEYVGVLCIEFFVTKQGTLFINEIAPRPHNSGHYSLDACLTSQFEQQVRALAQLPLGSSRLLSPVVMLNLLGDEWHNGHEIAFEFDPNWQEVLKLNNAKLHLYGKSEPKKGRKMGHINFLASSVKEGLNNANEVISILGIRRNK